MSDNIIEINGVSKKYKLGMIGGTSLREEIQRKMAKFRGEEDPTVKIGQAYDGNVGDEFLALDRISFSVKEGERIGIIGHNGAGKSTLLKLISRITAPSVGTIMLNGRVASMLEVGTGFHPELSGRENIYMNGAILGMSRKEINRKIDEIIDFSECRKFIDTPVKRYSSGMYVKLAFSVAAHLDSEILIMDEVLAVGDMAFQKKCIDRMTYVSEAENRTVLYVSHNMSTIRMLCQRCIVLDHGKVAYDGDVETAINYYLQNNKYDLGVEIDTSKSRMPHLPKEVDAKIEHISLCNKEEPYYAFNEPINIKLRIRSNRDIEKPCLRLEIRGVDGTSIGIAINHRIQPLIKNSCTEIEFAFDGKGIIPGRYKTVIVLYEVNQFGNYNDLDAIWPAFVYDVVDVSGEIEISWDKYNWGNIMFSRLELK